MPKRETITVTIEAMAHGGSGIGRHGRSTVFVPFTIPGERVEVRAMLTQGSTIFAEGERLLEASADRVFPVCPAFGPRGCFRCHWQHIAYDAQLLIKQDVLADQLERIGRLRDVTVRPVLPAPQTWGYLHHTSFTIGVDGRLELPARSGAGSIAIDDCALLHPNLIVLMEALDLDFSSLRNAISRIVLQIDGDGAPLLTLYMAQEEAPELETELQASVNLILPDHEPVNLIGDSHARYVIGGRSFRVTAGAFIRPHIAQLGVLTKTAVDLLELKGSEHVLDLYAGVGLFSAALAPQASLVTLVESYPPAVTDADDNLSNFDHIDIIEGGVVDVLQALNETYAAAVVDPPRAGLSPAIITRLSQLGVERIAYVSDDPVSLARESRKLAQAGYRLHIVQPVDLAPHSYFIDAIALFLRA
ncbi:MAG: TRAM domain-containing protein [Aggregatilineales bacterium]